jgi:hypothetical protein
MENSAPRVPFLNVPKGAGTKVSPRRMGPGVGGTPVASTDAACATFALCVEGAGSAFASEEASRLPMMPRPMPRTVAAFTSSSPVRLSQSASTDQLQVRLTFGVCSPLQTEQHAGHELSSIDARARGQAAGGAELSNASGSPSGAGRFVH